MPIFRVVDKTGNSRTVPSGDVVDGYELIADQDFSAMKVMVEYAIAEEDTRREDDGRHGRRVFRLATSREANYLRRRLGVD